MSRHTAIFCWLFAAFVSLPLQAQPTLSSTEPGAVVPGKTAELKLIGDKLTEPLNVWTSFPAMIEIIPQPKDKKNPKLVTCRVTLGANVPVGIGGIFIGNVSGVSDVVMLMVDDMPSVTDNGKNHSRETAQALTLPVAIDGKCDGATFDYYKFTATAGQRVSVEAVAARLGSKMDAVVRLYDTAGKEVLTADDDEGIGADPRFVYTCEKAGDYTLEVRDNKYQAGGSYRLRVGDFPVVSTPFPLGGQLGQQAKLKFTGQAIEGAQADLKVPANLLDGFIPVSVRAPGGRSSGMATLATDSLSEAVESEPNDAKEKATKVTLPCAVSGVLGAAKDRDYYQFDAKKGQRFVFGTMARSLGSPTLTRLQIFDTSGKSLAETKVSDADEEKLTYVFPADGSYFLLVEDLLRRGGPNHAYRVRIQSSPSFGLNIKNDKATKTKFFLPQHDGAFAVFVQCSRDAYNGPVKLIAEADGVALPTFSDVIPAKGKEVKLIVTAPTGLKEGDVKAIRIIGEAEINGQTVRAVANSSAYLRAKMPQMPYPPVWMSGLINAAVSKPNAIFFETTFDKKKVYFPQPFGETLFTLTLQRKDKAFKAGLQVWSEGLPAGFSAAVKAEKDNYKVTLKGPKNAAEANHRFRLYSYAEHGGKGRIVADEIEFQVIKPLSVSVVAVGDLRAGGKQKVRIIANRQGTERQPIDVTWKKLPAGVSGGKAQIPADKEEVEVELTVAADTKPGEFKDSVISAKTKYTGKDLQVDSQPFTLKVVK